MEEETTPAAIQTQKQQQDHRDGVDETGPDHDQPLTVGGGNEDGSAQYNSR